ncbi:MAG: hypothetical protein RRB22_13740 [Gammaproteobacteria bacterium]|nr:hypothetical protein [Gammaproteobacteria bacterium]
MPRSSEAIPTTSATTHSAIDQRTRQRIGEEKREIAAGAEAEVSGLDVSGLPASGLTRLFYPDFGRIAGVGAGGRYGQDSVPDSVQRSAQRALDAYTTVATQEHRDEVVSLLGIDVFA